MKLAILAQAYLLDKTAPINGTLVQLHNLTHGFSSIGIEVHYVAQTKDRSKPFTQVVDGINFHWIPSKKGMLAWKKTMTNYKTILETIQPDAIYVRGRSVLQYVAGIYAKSNKVTYVWGTNGEDSAEFYKNTKRIWSSNKNLLKKLTLTPLKSYEDRFINKGMKMAHKVINQSEQQRQATKNNLRKSGQVLPSYFFNTSKTVVGKENLVLWFANLSIAKQPECFIETIQKCDLKDWKAEIAGGSKDKTYEETIGELARANAIKMIGKVDFEHSFQYYQRAKIYINTSKPFADGLPNAYIQSWLNGVVVLSLHHNPNNWMEKQNIGYCSEGDLNQLIIKLQELIDSPEQLSKMSQNAQMFAKAQFSDPKILKSYLNIFEGRG